MLRKLALAAAVSFGVAAVPAGALAMHGGGGGGHGGFSGGGGGHGGFSGGGGGHGGFSGGGGGHGGFSGGGGGHGGFSGGGLGGRSVGSGFTPHGMPGGNALVNRGVVAHPFVNGGHATPLGRRYVTAGGRFAWHNHHRFRGRHIHGFLPGFGYGYYWYYGDCWVWTDYGWIDMCGYQDDPAS